MALLDSELVKCLQEVLRNHDEVVDLIVHVDLRFAMIVVINGEQIVPSRKTSISPLRCEEVRIEKTRVKQEEDRSLWVEVWVLMVRAGWNEIVKCH